MASSLRGLSAYQASKKKYALDHVSQYQPKSISLSKYVDAFGDTVDLQAVLDFSRSMLVAMQIDAAHGTGQSCDYW